jgi:hypothetical protein
VWHSCQKSSPDKLHPPTLRKKFFLKLPSRFRERRALAIASWFIPDEQLRWEIILELGLLPDDLSFENKGLSHSLEIRLLNSSDFICERYLNSGLINLRQLFGTILKEDLQNALQNLQILPVPERKPRSKVRRKGYQDKGSRREAHKWTETHDYSFTEEHCLRELKQTIIQTFYLIFLKKLSDLE